MPLHIFPAKAKIKIVRIYIAIFYRIVFHTMIHSQDLHKYLQKYQDIERKFFMIARTDIFNINFYKKERFHGSYKGMHYRIEKYAPEEGDTVLRVTVWPGPYNFDTTPDEQKTSASYPFTDDGLTEVCDYLNKFHTEHFCD